MNSDHEWQIKDFINEQFKTYFKNGPHRVSSTVGLPDVSNVEIIDFIHKQHKMYFKDSNAPMAISDVIYLILDYLGLKVVTFPEKTKLVKKENNK